MRGEKCECGEVKLPAEVQCKVCKALHDERAYRTKKVGVKEKNNQSYKAWGVQVEQPIAGGSMAVLAEWMANPRKALGV